ncbi:hypothetical protein ACFV6E_09470 [Streptomyces sp. NPDC059785]|uniref:hypothetical protein n=1 Tax=unclassified Streptomyces TaxID=2593676 RepID=UPI00366564E2
MTSTSPPSQVRLLPWSGPDGKAALLVTDGRATPMALLADSIEADQLSDGAAVLKLSRDILITVGQPTADEALFLIRRLTECLTDSLRICESRGHRIPPYADDGLFTESSIMAETDEDPAS